jgi:sulfatase modifying factor 1
MRASLISLSANIVLVICAWPSGAQTFSPNEVKNSAGMKLVYVPPGKFMMGSPDSEPGREPQETLHEVELTKGFFMGACEVTVGQFKQFVTATKFRTDGECDGKGAYGIDGDGAIKDMKAEFTWKNPGFDQTDEHPVVNVSWSDAKAFCKWLSEKEKKTYRLPTEAEWEYACRAGTKTAYGHGDDPEGLAAIGNGADATARAKYPEWSIGIQAKDGYVFTAPVGQFRANALGLHDMHGNVWEWCEDWYVPNSFSREKQIDPTGPATGKARVQRGGGWSSDAKRLRSAARIGRDPVAYRGCYLGFRVVLEQADERSAKVPLRVQTQGNSWSYNTNRLRAIEKTAGLPESVYYPGSEVIAGKPGPVYMPGCLNGRKTPFRESTTLKSRLEERKIDVFTYTHSNWHETEIAEEVAEFSVRHNPNFQVLWQAGWNVHDGLGISKNGPARDAVRIADLQKALDKNRKLVEARVDEINKKLGKHVVRIVPVGDAFVQMRALVAEGKFPGVTKQSELFNDDMPHQGRLGSLLQDYCIFVTLHHRSPVGLYATLDQTITEEQAAILQKMAWETVSTYRPSGVQVIR